MTDISSIGYYIFSKNANNFLLLSIQKASKSQEAVH